MDSSDINQSDISDVYDGEVSLESDINQSDNIDDGEVSLESELSSVEILCEQLTTHFQTLDFLDFIPPKLKITEGNSLITSMEKSLRDLEENISSTFEKITDLGKILSTKLQDLSTLKEDMSGQSYMYDMMNPGDFDDEEDAQQTEDYSKQCAEDAGKVEKAIDAINSIKPSIPDGEFIEKLLFRAQSQVKWLAVLLKIVSYEFKTNKGPGNHSHPEFENYSSPTGAVLTYGHLLELFSKLIFKSFAGSAEHVGGAGDDGIDLLVGAESLPCQVKNYKKPLGPSVLREFLGTLVLRGKKEGFIIYSSGDNLTPSVKSVVTEAGKKGYKIHIWTLGELAEKTAKYCNNFKSDEFVKEHVTFDLQFNKVDVQKYGDDFEEAVKNIRDSIDN